MPVGRDHDEYYAAKMTAKTYSGGDGVYVTVRAHTPGLQSGNMGVEVMVGQPYLVVEAVKNGKSITTKSGITKLVRSSDHLHVRFEPLGQEFKQQKSFGDWVMLEGYRMRVIDDPYDELHEFGGF